MCMLSEGINFDLISLPAIFLWNAAGFLTLAKAALGSSCPAEQVKWTMPWLFFAGLLLQTHSSPKFQKQMGSFKIDRPIFDEDF